MMRKESLIKLDNNCEFVLVFEDKTISLVLVPFKRAPYVEEVLYVLLRNKRFVRLMKWYDNNYIRKNPFYVSKREGLSGAIDYKLLVAYPIKGTGYYKIKSVAKIHISMNHKLNQGIPEMFIGDFLEIIRSDDYVFNFGTLKYLKIKYKYLKGIRDEDIIHFKRMRLPEEE